MNISLESNMHKHDAASTASSLSTTDSCSCKLEINSRIRVQNDVGTVRYIGQVQGYPKEWLGIEWDDVTRGKHNGTINGIEYFKTSHPTTGSMVRSEKIDSFESAREAIESRYIFTSETPIDDDLLKETQKKTKASLFEIVGVEKIRRKQSHWEDLIDISIANTNVNCSGDLSPLKRLRVLNLSETLIPNWNVVANVVKQLPNLQHLNLSSNRLKLPSDSDVEQLEKHFRHLHTLYLRNCSLNVWQDIVQIAKLWPYISHLYLDDNQLESIDAVNSNDIFKNLRCLNLQRNNLSDFQEILKLGNIKTLECLYVKENNIKIIKLPDCNPNEHLNIFMNLKEINIRDNPIVDESEVFNEFDKLPNLSNLSHTPVNQLDGFPEMFSNAVALMSKLCIINKVVISKEDRRGAEYDIFKKYGKIWMNTIDNENERNSFNKHFRAYSRLVEKYGSPHDLVETVPKVSNLITCTIINSKTGEEIIKKLPKRMTIQTLQGLILKLFNSINTTLPKLSYVTGDRIDLKVDMDNLSKNLDYYSVQNGDIIIIE